MRKACEKQKQMWNLTRVSRISNWPDIYLVLMLGRIPDNKEGLNINLSPIPTIGSTESVNNLPCGLQHYSWLGVKVIRRELGIE